jgi:hypothetical protein
MPDDTKVQQVQEVQTCIVFWMSKFTDTTVEQEILNVNRFQHIQAKPTPSRVQFGLQIRGITYKIVLLLSFCKRSDSSLETPFSVTGP